METKLHSLKSNCIILKFPDTCVGVIKKIFLHKGASSQKRSDFRLSGSQNLRSFLLVFCFATFLSSLTSQSHIVTLTEEIRSEVNARNYEKSWELYSALTKEYADLNLAPDTTYGKASLYIAQSYLSSNKNKESTNHYHKAIEIMEQDTLLEKIYAMKCYLGIGVAYKRMSEFKTAEGYYHKAKNLVITRYGPDYKGLHNIYNNLGNVNRILGDYDSSIENHKEAIRLRTLQYPAFDYHIGDSYNNLGLVYTDLNQNSKAIIHFNQALRHYRDNSISIKVRAAKVGYNISRIYYNLGNYDKCLQYLDPAIELMEQAGGEQEFNYAEMLNIKTHLLIKTGQLDEAKKVLDQTIFQKTKYLSADHLNWIYTNNAASEIANKRGDYLEADVFYRKNLKIINIYHAGFHPEKVQVWQRLLQNAINRNDSVIASECLDSLKHLINDPNIELVNGKYQEILNYEEGKYLFFVYELSGDVSILKRSASKAYLSIFPSNTKERSLNLITQKLIAGEDRQFADLAIKINEAAYNATNDNIYLENTFKIADYQKSTILKEMVIHDQTIYSNRLPEEQQKRSVQLKSLLNQLRSEFYQDNNQLSVAKYDSLYAELREIQSKNAINNLVDNISNSQDQSVDIQALIETVRKENSIILSYYWSNDQLYIHRIDTEGIQLTKVDFSDPTILLRLRDGLLNMDSQIGDFIEIYDLLLDKVISDKDEGKNIIIIPDRQLHLIPFEVMKPSLLKGKYLIEIAPISYAYSAEYLLKVKSIERRADKSVLAFAPEYNYQAPQYLASSDSPKATAFREGNQRLKGALASVEKIGEILESEVLIGNEATLDAFHQLSDDYKILHFSMHAYENLEDPLSSALIFEPKDSLGNQLLTARDIFNSDLSCDLAVLAACNTGYGQLNISEGIQSLSYSFSYAGAKSTIMSLWPVPDEATSMIMQSFYTYLKEDYNKAEALQLAKLDYIKNAVDKTQKHPYFWAGFVLGGDISPIELGVNFNWMWLVVFSLLSVSLFILYRKKTRI